MKNKPNFLLITLDSCRWDTYCKAATPNLDKFCSIKKAYTQATFTYASHLSMYQGLFPSVRENIPYYNRFSKPLFRISNRRAAIESFVSFPSGTKTIIHGLRCRSYYTICLGAVNWFRHIELTFSCSIIQGLTL